LRSFNNREPFPEEANRRVASVLADLHFAPTSRARDNLIKEGIPAEKILLTGNTVVDALTWMVKKVRSEPPLLPARVEEIIASGKKIILVTGHRRESFGEGFRNICEAMRQLSQTNPDIAFVYPVHMNPNVQEPVFRLLGDCPGIHLIEPLPYKSFVRLMDCCALILTDSGGIQEEGPSLGKPVLVMRNLTERPEGIEAGCAKLVGTDPEKIVSEVMSALDILETGPITGSCSNPYGDGTAAEKILETLMLE
jgi:UDP-N-acetylglucosamine 2-epimerase